VRAGEEILRRSIASASDGRVRARLRVELAELVRGHDDAAARDELDQAAREGGATPALASAALSLARAMPPGDRVAFIASLTRVEGKTPVPTLVSALADAQLHADRPREAALTWLGLARDERVAVHHRRAAARRAVGLATRLEPAEARDALTVAAALVSGKPRLALLQRARALPGGAPAGEGEPAARDRVEPPAAPKPPHRAPPVRARSKVTRAMPGPTAVLESALVEARAGHANRARRLGEEAIRLSVAGTELTARVGALDTALREGGFMKDALRVRRTHLEALDSEPARSALRALAEEADAAGLPALAADWRADAGAARAATAVAAPPPATPAEYYLAAQRLLARDGAEASPKLVLGLLEKALAGHPGADAALALAETIAAKISAGVEAGEASARQSVALDLLRAAHAAEFEPTRRARLGRRLAETLEARGDAIGAVAVLESALGEAAPGEGERVRAERARLLRTLGRSRELAAALEKDAGALAGDARLAVLAEHATLLEVAGEAEKALEVRLMALAEFPGAPPVLDEARRRLEATGREGESLALAIAALDHTTDAERRGRLLRDVATLTERAGTSANPIDAANAWLAVLDVDPLDGHAAAAAERFLVAAGDWERCADLLAWSVARAGADARPEPEAKATRAALLWRLAELRRARLGQTDEALRLYADLAAAGRSPLGPLDDSPTLSAFIRRHPELAVETARATVAPAPADRARALVDRADLLAAAGRADDAERDALAAVDLDPRNMEALAVLEKLFDGSARARILADELGRRAAKLGPPVAAPLFYGRGRAAARAGDNASAREAYRRAMSLDPTLAEPIAALGALAAREGDWSEVAALLESEVNLATSPARKGALLLELAVVYGDRLGDPARAVALLETAAPHFRDEPRIFDLGARFNLAAGNWQAAAVALDQIGTRNAPIAGAAERYFAVGAAAEAAGEIDRALTLYSRSYSRDGGFRPTLERLSQICFDRGAPRATRGRARARGARDGAGTLGIGRSPPGPARDRRRQAGRDRDEGAFVFARGRHPRRRRELGRHAPRAPPAGGPRGPPAGAGAATGARGAGAHRGAVEPGPPPGAGGVGGAGHRRRPLGGRAGGPGAAGGRSRLRAQSAGRVLDHGGRRHGAPLRRHRGGRAVLRPGAGALAHQSAICAACGEIFALIGRVCLLGHACVTSRLYCGQSAANKSPRKDTFEMRYLRKLLVVALLSGGLAIVAGSSGCSSDNNNPTGTGGAGGGTAGAAGGHAGGASGAAGGAAGGASGGAAGGASGGAAGGASGGAAGGASGGAAGGASGA
jgi:tetratricopeptide (TPR) repeat protein